MELGKVIEEERATMVHSGLPKGVILGLWALGVISHVDS